MTWFLIDSSGYRYPVVATGLSVGRAIDNDVVLDDEEASRHHAYIQLQGEQAWLYDSSSANGVFVNGERITEPRLLQAGDKLRFGKSLFQVEYVAPPPIGPASVTPTPSAASSSIWQAVLAGVLIGFLGLVAVFFLFVRPLLTPAPEPATSQDYDIYADVLRSIAFILSPLEDAATATGGTAVVINENGRLLTAYSVVIDPQTGRSYNRKGQVLVGINPSGRYTGAAIPDWYLARVVRSDRQRDLAVVQIYALADGSPLPNSFRLAPAPLGEAADLKPGAPVKVLSFVGGGVDQQRDRVGRTLVLGEGQLLGYVADASLNNEQGWLQTNIGLSQSNVGGLALDEKGRLIGLYTGVNQSEGAASASGLLRPINLANTLLAGS